MLTETMIEIVWDYVKEHAKEVVFLSIDMLLFGVTTHMYLENKHNIYYVQQCKQKGENNSYSYNELENNKTYGIVKGTVEPIGRPLQSLHDGKVTGVVQKLTRTEHIKARSGMGFWHDTKRILDFQFKTSPFYILTNNGLKVTVHDPLEANRIDLNMTYDAYETANLNFMDIFIGIFSGSRQRGIQTTEEMLPVGCAVNIIGDIVISQNNSQSIVPPQDKPYYIITESVQSLLNHLESNKKFFKYLSLVFGAIGIILIYHRFNEIKKKYLENKLKEEQIRKLRETRKERRAAVRDNDVIEELRCVICQTNGREIVLMPCGHFCLCEDCNDNVEKLCPMCKAVIENRVPTYL